MQYNAKRMPAHCYETAPQIVRDHVAFIAESGCEASGVPYDVLFRESDDRGNITGLDFGDRLRGCHFELSRMEAQTYRQRNAKKRRAWNDLPKGVQETIIAYLESE